MKKTIVSIILILLCFSLLADDPSVPHYMLGYVETQVDFSVSILEDVLPFDLSSPEVQENSEYESEINGLRIGEYTLVSNSKGFEFYIAHTKLKYVSGGGQNDPNTLEEIDYRLYAVLGNGNLFYSSLSDASASTPDEATNNIAIKGEDGNVWTESMTSLSIVNKSLYVSLEDKTVENSTAATVAALKSGLYSSTIYFLLKGR